MVRPVVTVTVITEKVNAEECSQWQNNRSAKSQGRQTAERWVCVQVVAECKAAGKNKDR